MSDYPSTRINGVKLYVKEDGHITYYSTDPDSIHGGDFTFHQSTNRAEGTATLSGAAFGKEAIETARKVFPKMEFQPWRGASDDDGHGDLEAIEFHKTSKY